MSTEHQQYSTANQADMILRYAESNGMVIIRTYQDAGKSGLSLNSRYALQQLIREVESKKPDFEAILVYDVSRWGRFQDTDESAYYEFLCKRAKVRVHYCAETFVNDGSLSSTLLKTIKRTMAGEYSRELSVKVFAGKARLIELGFRQGGHAGYGLRRLLQDQDGNPKGFLMPGERKSIFTDRVILVPGSAEEITVVSEIYKRYTEERESCSTIARELNKRGILNERGGSWSRSIIHCILTNPKYIGSNVFNRTSFKLGAAHVQNPLRMWIRRDDAFTPIVSAETFRRAQEILAGRNRYYTDEELLGLLRGLWKEVGYLSTDLVNRTKGLPSRNMYDTRFHGLRRAYELIGYKSPFNCAFVDEKKKLRLICQEHLTHLVADLTSVGACVHQDGQSDFLKINDEFTVSFFLVRCRETKRRGYRWQFALSPTPNRADITIAARMAPGNKSILDYYLFPGLGQLSEWLDLALENSVILDSHRFTDLSFLMDLVSRVELKEIQ